MIGAYNFKRGYENKYMATVISLKIIEFERAVTSGNDLITSLVTVANSRVTALHKHINIYNKKR